MNKLILALLLVSTSAIAAFDSPSNRAIAQDMIQNAGYKCDTIDSMRVSQWDGDITVVCNNYRYSYEIKDVGGNYVVTVD